MKRRRFAGLVVLVVVIVGAWFGWRAWQSRASAPSRGQQVYDQNCAVCHGSRGDGKGEAAYVLLPKPRNFRAGKFRLVSSQNLEPTRQDLFETITNGMAGTAMPSWAHLPEADRLALADYILKFNRDGWVDIALARGETRVEAEKYADEMVQPGDPIQVPPEPPKTPEGLKEGKKFYLTACANCHGQNGEGRQDPTWRTAEGYPTWSRNLRSGVFKGGREGQQLYIRFATGLPGTPMPNQALTPEQIWRVVQYVQSLSDPAAQEQAQIRAKEIVVKRVQSLPASPDDASWDKVPEVRIALMPLWWRDGYVEAVRVKAMHDGRRLAIRLEWNDSTRDVEGVRVQTFPDGAAVQLTANPSPPLFAMGAPGQSVNIWHWKALWAEDRQEFQDVGTAYPGMVADAYYGSQEGWKSDPLTDSTYRPAAHADNLLASPHRTTMVEDANAAGLGTVTPQAAAKQHVQGVSHWEGGVWRLQFVRELSSSGREDVPLTAGKRASVAFAVWNGSVGDRNGQKSVSIWNTLILE